MADDPAHKLIQRARFNRHNTEVRHFGAVPAFDQRRQHRQTTPLCKSLLAYRRSNRKSALNSMCNIRGSITRKIDGRKPAPKSQQKSKVEGEKRPAPLRIQKKRHDITPFHLKYLSY